MVQYTIFMHNGCMSTPSENILVGLNIRKIRESKSLSQKELAALASMDASNLSKLERGEYPWSQNTLLRISSALQVNLGRLFDVDLKVDAGEAQIIRVPVTKVQAIEDEEDYDHETGVMVPVYDIEVSAGPGIPVPEFTEMREKLHFTKKWMKKKGAELEDLMIFPVRGESMQPTLWDGDKVTVHRGLNRVRSGRMFALAYAGEARVKRLYTLADGRLRVVSDNADKHQFPDELIEGEHLNNVLIIGQVIHKMGEGGL